MHWRQHVEPVIKSHNLPRFVVNPVVPLRYLTEDNRIADRVNLEYETWEVQDQTLLVLVTIYTFKVRIVENSWFQSLVSSLGQNPRVL